MTRDQKIEKVLADFYQERHISISDYIYSEFGDSNDPENRKECDYIIDCMQHCQLISSPEIGELASILPKGINIYESGGWLKHLEMEKLKVQNEENRKAAEIEKLQYDIRLVKRKLRTYWWFFGFTIVSFLMGLISLLLHLYQFISK